MWSAGYIEPRYHTPVEPNAKILALAREMAPTCGVPGWWGWQELVMCLGLARRGDTWRYRTVVVVVSRQNGKTSLAEFRIILGLRLGEQIGFAQQDRAKGREKFLEIADRAEASLKRCTVTRRLGEESIRYGNGRLKLLTPDRKGARSITADTIIIDEAAYISPEFVAAVRPTTVTRRAQIWMLSSAGDARSVDLARVRAAARARLDDADSSVALVEFGVDPGSDYSSEAIWAAAVPTLGLEGGARIEALRDDFLAMDEHDFAREYLGVWSEDSLDRPIDAEAWAEAQVADLDGLHSVVCAVDSAPDQSCAAVALAGMLPDGTRAAALVSFDSGDDWLERDLAAVWSRWKPTRLVVDATTPAARLIPFWRNKGYEVTKNSAAVTAAACSDLAAMLKQRNLKVAHDENLTAAAMTASRRKLANGWAFDRRGDAAPIAPIAALALAVGNRNSHIGGTGGYFSEASIDERRARSRREIPGVHY